MYEVYFILKNEIKKLNPNETISFEIINPDIDANESEKSQYLKDIKPLQT